MRSRVWKVLEPVPPSEHRFKYSLFYGRPDQRVVLYDNERGKSDYRHYGEYEEAYVFKDVETLRSDFLIDVQRVRSGG